MARGKLAIVGGLLFGLGYLLAAAALQWRSLPLLYLGYGVIGGTGLGLCYVTPVATVAKWFPDKKGLATGLVIMGFGFGALLMSKLIAPALYAWSDGNLVTVFLWLGGCFTAATLLGTVWLRKPPPGYAPGTPRPWLRAIHRRQRPIPPAVGIVSGRFAAMWLIFFCNIVAGISLISFQSPMLQDWWRRLEPSLSAATLSSYGAWLIAASAVFNGVGRILWGGFPIASAGYRPFAGCWPRSWPSSCCWW